MMKSSQTQGAHRPDAGMREAQPHAHRDDLSSVPVGAEIAAADDPLALRVLRRAIDVVFAATVLVLMAPLMIVVAIGIRRDSPGPALFRQVRMARNRRTRTVARPQPGERRKTHVAGQPFRFFKFRTLYVDARERFPELYAYDYSPAEIESLVFKSDADPRITPMGRWLRKSSLDELPNFINLLLGDITLVGPRPEIPEMSRYYTERQRKKFSVKPGVTGEAQISGRALLTWQETVELDVAYVERRSLRLDLMIVLKTVKAAFVGRGAF